MKVIIVSFIIFFMVVQLQGQSKYKITTFGGWQHLLAQRGPRGETAMSPVKFAKPIFPSVGFAFDINVSNKIDIGIELSYAALNWGYISQVNTTQPTGLGINSGMLGNSGKTDLYTFGFRTKYNLFSTQKWKGDLLLIPILGFYPFDKQIADTAATNSFDRTTDTLYSNPTLYINYPPYQNQGFYFLMRLGYETELKLGKHIGLTGRISYQQGFQTFLIGYTNIQRLRDPSGPIQQLYYTKVNGTAVQWHFGLRYNFK